MDSELFIGLDTSKLKISVAVADGGGNGEVRFYGDISSDPGSVASMVEKLAKRASRLHFCYEAGPPGYELYRQIIELGHACEVVAPSLIPRRSGDRVKTNRRDAVSLARLHRAGELTGVWVPDETHEAIRDLVRAREAANDALKKSRQQLQAFLLRRGHIYSGQANALLLKRSENSSPSSLPDGPGQGFPTRPSAPSPRCRSGPRRRAGA